jgi:chaperonin GroEL (HSP60 family)
MGTRAPIDLVDSLPELNRGRARPNNNDQKVGIDIVRRALQAPARQIVENAGADGAVVIGKLLEKATPTMVTTPRTASTPT